MNLRDIEPGSIIVPTKAAINPQFKRAMLMYHLPSAEWRRGSLSHAVILEGTDSPARPMAPGIGMVTALDAAIWGANSLEVVEPTDADTQAMAKAIVTRPGWQDNAGYAIASGTDPEFFYVDDRNIVIPAFTVLPSKDKALDGVFWDGFQGEFDTPAAHCLQQLAQNIIVRLQTAMQSAPAGTKLVLRSVVDLQNEHMQLEPRYLALGCSPSLNVYGSKANLNEAPEFIPFRFAGCHIHFGIGGPVTMREAERCVKSMDKIAGVAMCALFGHLEDTRRRMFYGLAGEYRIPQHGLEWRVPGPQVMAHPCLYQLCFELARTAFRMGLNGSSQYLWDCSDGEAIAAINTSDQALARKILRRNETVLKGLLAWRFTAEAVPGTLKTLYEGVESRFADLEDIKGNWHLDAALNITNSAYTWKWAALQPGRI